MDYDFIRRILVQYRSLVNWWPYFSDESEIVVSAILTQNTNWNNVLSSLTNIKNFLGSISLEDIRDLEIDTLKELIKPSGFYENKSRTIINVLDYIHGKGGFYLLKSNLHSQVASKRSLKEGLKVIKDFRNELLKIKGIGKETADSIILYAFELPTFVIDTYTVRIINRVFSEKFNKDKHYEKLREFFEDTLIKNLYNLLKIFPLFGNKPSEVLIRRNVVFTLTITYKVLHASFVEIGKGFCGKKTTNCEKCKILNVCIYGKNELLA